MCCKSWPQCVQCGPDWTCQHGAGGLEKGVWLSPTPTWALPWEVSLVHTEGVSVPATDFTFKGQDWKSGGPKFCSWFCNRLTLKLVEACLCFMRLFLQQMEGGKSCIFFGVHNFGKVNGSSPVEEEPGAAEPALTSICLRSCFGSRRAEDKCCSLKAMVFQHV